MTKRIGDRSIPVDQMPLHIWKDLVIDWESFIAYKGWSTHTLEQNSRRMTSLLRLQCSITVNPCISPDLKAPANASSASESAWKTVMLVRSPIQDTTGVLLRLRDCSVSKEVTLDASSTSWQAEIKYELHYGRQGIRTSAGIQFPRKDEEDCMKRWPEGMRVLEAKLLLNFLVWHLFIRSRIRSSDGFCILKIDAIEWVTGCCE